jgi:FkbM family methyltransferase
MAFKSLVRNQIAKAPLLDGVFRRFIWSRMHFPEMEMRFIESLPPGSMDVAIDVGAALGSYAWLLDRKARQVYSFEPGRAHHDYLNRLLWGTNISLTRAAVGSRCGTVEFFTPGTDTNALHSATLSASNPVVQTAGTRVEKVEQVSLDEFFRDRLEAGRRIDFLKVDVEGYELEVFRGAVGLIEAHRPMIVCEIEARHNSEYAKVFQLLRGAGYRCFVYRRGQLEAFDDETIESVQQERDLAIRLGPDYVSAQNSYINNFVFQHPGSRIKVTQ